MSSIFGYIHDISITPHFFLLVALLVKCLLVSAYCILIYAGLKFAQNRLRNYIGARGNYYIWYSILLSLPLSGFGWNDFLKLPIYRAVRQEWRVVLFVAVVIWLFVSILKLMKLLILSLKIRKLIATAKPYKDSDNLSLRAANAVGLQSEDIHIAALEGIGSPVSYGMFKKTILLPADYEERYTWSELYLLLLHEMVHIKNHDTVKLFYLSFFKCFIWILQLFERSFKRDVEILCDNRVMSLRDGAFNAYGELLIKECAAQTAVKGLSFSDSYHAIASRLDALYRFKPDKRRYTAFAAAVLVLLFVSALWSYHNPADWFIPNESSCTEFDVNIMLGETNSAGEPEYTALPMPTDMAKGVYKVSENELQINIPSLLNAVDLYHDAGQSIEEIWFQSTVYAMDMGIGENNLAENEQAYVEYTMPYSELLYSGEEYRYFPISQTQNDSLFIYSLIAHWL